MLSLNAFAGDDGGGGAGEGLYRALNPGATLLAKWLPVFFVPSLIALPLASGIGNAWEVRVPVGPCLELNLVRSANRFVYPPIGPS